MWCVCVSGDQPHAQDAALGRGSPRVPCGRGRGPSEDRKTRPARARFASGSPCHLPGSRPGVGPPIQFAGTPPPPGTSWFGSRSRGGASASFVRRPWQGPSLPPSGPDRARALAECPGRPPGQGRAAPTSPKLFVLFKPRRGLRASSVSHTVFQCLSGLCSWMPHVCTRTRSYAQAHG